MSTLGRPGVGERELLKAPSSPISLEGKFFFLQFLENATEDLITATREYFQKNPRVPIPLRWVGKPANSQGEETDIIATGVHIAQEYADQEPKYPSVLVASVDAQIQDLWLNNQRIANIIAPNPRYDNSIAMQDQEEPPELEVGERLAGKLLFQITVNVRGETPAEVDQIADVYIHGLVGPIRRTLQERYGYAWVPSSARVGTKRPEVYTNKKPVFARTFNFSMSGDWVDDFYYNDITVKDILEQPTRDTTETIE